MQLQTACLVSKQTYRAVVFHSFISFLETCARQAQQAQLGTYWSYQLSPTRSVLCYTTHLELCMKGGLVAIAKCIQTNIQSCCVCSSKSPCSKLQ